MIVLDVCEQTRSKKRSRIAEESMVEDVSVDKNEGEQEEEEVSSQICPTY